MGWLAFIAALVKAVAWPAAFIFALFLFRRTLAELLPNLRELKIMGTEMRFERLLRKAVDEVTHELLPDVVTQSTPSVSDGHTGSASLFPLPTNRRLLRYLVMYRLSHFDRLLIILYYFEEQSIPRIAEQLGVSEKFAEERRESIIRQLRAWMAETK
jgi:DNA-directed RNA polymerase specialized sigma24 family protein